MFPAEWRNGCGIRCACFESGRRGGWAMTPAMPVEEECSMRVERDWLRTLVFEMSETRRFTQDSPILPEVWLSGGVAYCRGPEVRVDLLLTPHKEQTAGILARAILDGLEAAFATREYAPTGA